jgi:hypothetical protein
LLPELTCYKGNSIMYVAKLNIQQGCCITWKGKQQPLYWPK